MASTRADLSKPAHDRVQVHLRAVGADQLPMVGGHWSSSTAVRRWMEDLTTQAERLATRVGTEHRGALVTGIVGFLAEVNHPGPVVGVMIAETYDRWATVGGDGKTVVLDPRPTATVGLAVDPAWRGRGIGTAVFEAIPTQPELGGMALFVTAIEAHNTGACRAAAAGGWRRFSEEPDREGMVWYRRERAR